MNDEGFDKLSDEEINTACAKIMGWICCDILDNGELFVWCKNLAIDHPENGRMMYNRDKPSKSRNKWNPINDLNQAVMVAEKLGEWRIEKINKYDAACVYQFEITQADSAAKALCLAAIKAAGKK